jgi:hypothetical protein
MQAHFGSCTTSADAIGLRLRGIFDLDEKSQHREQSMTRSWIRLLRYIRFANSSPVSWVRRPDMIVGRSILNSTHKNPSDTCSVMIVQNELGLIRLVDNLGVCICMCIIFLLVYRPYIWCSP